MNITFPDGSVKQYEDGMTALQIAESISPRLRKATLAAEIDGSRADAFRPIAGDHSIKLLTWEDEDGRWTMRHTAAHILAQAVKRVHPEAKLAIGPAIDTGFYYDFDAEPFTPEDLEQIQKEMEKIIAEALPLERFEMPRADAIKYFEEKGEPYKVELIQDLPEDAIISFYRQGDFTDLCAGPHVENTGKVKFVKLMSVAGAYWRGSEKNKMLQRIYGTAFEKKADLEEYITRIEEAKKRDHRKLGKDLELFCFSQRVGQGLPLWLPKGAALRDRLQAGLLAAIPHCKINGDQDHRLPNTLNISFEGVEGEALLLQLDQYGICASSGSACTSGSLEPSHVLRAMGVPFNYAHGSVRFSLSRYNTEAEIDRVIEVMPRIVSELRKISPFASFLKN